MSLPKPYYQDDAVTLYHADSREILPQIESDTVDMIWADPPYGHNNNNGDLAHNREAALGLVQRGKATAGEARPIANDGAEAGPLVQWMLEESARLLKPGHCCCCCCGGGPDPQFARWSLWMDAAMEFKQMIVWDKGGLGMGWHYRRNYETVLVGNRAGAAVPWFGGNSVGNVIRLSGIKPGADDHPTPKPLELPMKFITWHTQPGDLVVDPFLGGGPSMEAVKLLGRRGIGIELDERWLEIAARRLQQNVLAL